MKSFIVLILVIGVVFGAPQYAYGPPNYQHNSGSNSISPSGGNIGVSNNYLAPQTGNAISQNFQGFGPSKQNAETSGPQQVQITKQFFIHSAPEEQDDIGGDKVINLGPRRKHYRVVFIKAPHQNIQGGKVRFVAPANEEKTVIYVLSKKTDLADIAADVQQAHSEPTKPEVHFIKYKTQEEAAHAQRTIQAQYDAIQGTSQISDEGIAPVQSVIGVLGDSNNNNSGQVGQSSDSSFTNNGFGATGSVSNTINDNSGVAAYLPPSH